MQRISSASEEIHKLDGQTLRGRVRWSWRRYKSHTSVQTVLVFARDRLLMSEDSRGIRGNVAVNSVMGFSWTLDGQQNVHKEVPVM